MRLLAVDPGLTTGWALFQKPETRPKLIGEVKEPQFHAWLKNWRGPELLWVVENFRVRPKQDKFRYAAAWGECIPARIIGAILYHASLFDHRVELVEPQTKRTGYRILGSKPHATGSKNHVLDATAIGTAFLHRPKHKVDD